MARRGGAGQPRLGRRPALGDATEAVEVETQERQREHREVTESCPVCLEKGRAQAWPIASSRGKASFGHEPLGRWQALRPRPNPAERMSRTGRVKRLQGRQCGL